MTARHVAPGNKQQGFSLLEALIAILIFSLSLLGLIGIQGSAIGLSIDAKHRSDASYLANQILAQMWVDRANLNTYAHYATENAADACAPGGAASTNPKVVGTTGGSWTEQVAETLPGATANRQQIRVVDTTATINGNEYKRRQVTIVVCWKRPQETTWRNHVTTSEMDAS